MLTVRNPVNDVFSRRFVRNQAVVERDKEFLVVGSGNFKLTSLSGNGRGKKAKKQENQGFRTPGAMKGFLISLSGMVGFTSCTNIHRLFSDLYASKSEVML